MTLPKFQVGDYAAHKYADLDPRPVAAVEGTKIRLLIGTIITDPVPMSSYRRIPARPGEATRIIQDAIAKITASQEA